MKYIDLRSDTVTQPTEEMRIAMAQAPVGDDVYEDDPTMNKFQKLAADMLGMEDAIFVPSGTMGNQLCIMTHTNKGEEIVVEADAHIVQHERAAVAMLSSVLTKTVKGNNGIMDIDELRRSIRPDDIHFPQTTLICLENALGNGTVAPLSYMKQVYDLAREFNVKVHLDGARLFNAATYLKCDVKEITANCDSVTFCISKGLCAPIGSIVAGTKEFIDKAKRNRKALGGGLRQAGILAAAGIIALEKMTKRLDIDHQNALYMADELEKLGCIELNKEMVHINMVYFRINKKDFDIYTVDKLLFDKGVKINGAGDNYGDEKGLFRFVASNDVSREDIDTVIKYMRQILN